MTPFRTRPLPPIKPRPREPLMSWVEWGGVALFAAWMVMMLWLATMIAEPCKPGDRGFLIGRAQQLFGCPEHGRVR